MKNRIRMLFLTVAFLLCMSSMDLGNVLAADATNDSYISQVEDYVELLKQAPGDNMVFSQNLIEAETVNVPFIIYRVGEKQQDKIYYYPISDDNGVIQFMVEAIIIDDVAECNITDNLVDLMNLVDYENEQVVVYWYNNSIYIETPSVSLNAFYYYNEPKARQLYSEKSGWDVTFEEKRLAIEEAERNMVEFSPISLTDTEDIRNMKMGGDLALSNPMGQYNYGMCWASCVATVHNYLRSTIITGYEVCTRMGIGYNDGGTIYDEQDALALYNISYDSARLSTLTWNQLTGNIDASKPIIINGISASNIAHAVTIYGYSGNISTASNIKFWNPNANNGSGGYATFSYTYGYFTDGSGTAYEWTNSLSYQ